MKSYNESQLRQVDRLVTEEINRGNVALKASFLSHKHNLPVTIAQQGLADLAAVGKLKPHYQVLCSGPQQNHDLDREFDDPRDIPRYPITCTKCGDIYTPEDENITVYFSPAE